MNRYLKRKITEKEAISIIHRNPEAIKKMPEFWGNKEVMVVAGDRDVSYLSLITDQLKKDTDFFIKVLEKNIGRRWNSFSVKILNYADDSCLGDKRLSDFLLKHPSRRSLSFLAMLNKKFHTAEIIKSVMLMDDSWVPSSFVLKGHHRDHNLPMKKLINSYLTFSLKDLRKKGILFKDVQLMAAHHDFSYALRLVKKLRLDFKDLANLKNHNFYASDLLDLDKKSQNLAKAFMQLHPELLSIDCPDNWVSNGFNFTRPLKIQPPKKIISPSIFTKKWKNTTYYDADRHIIARPDCLKTYLYTLKILDNYPRQKRINAFINIFNAYLPVAISVLKNSEQLINRDIDEYLDLLPPELIDMNVLEQLSELLYENYEPLKKDLKKNQDFLSPYSIHNAVLVSRKFKEGMDACLKQNIFSTLHTFEFIQLIKNDFYKLTNSLSKKKLENLIHHYMNMWILRRDYYSDLKIDFFKDLLSRDNQLTHWKKLCLISKDFIPEEYLDSSGDLYLNNLPNKDQFSIAKDIITKERKDYYFSRISLALSKKCNVLKSKKNAFKFVNASYHNLKKIDKKFLKDKAVIQYACLISPKSFRWADVSLKKDFNYLTKIFDSPEMIFKNAHISLKTQPRILLPAINKSLDVLKTLSNYRLINFIPFKELSKSQIKFIEDLVISRSSNDVFELVEIKNSFKEKYELISNQ